MRRDSKDKRWKDLKLRVTTRDSGDRLLKILTIEEAILFKESSEVITNILDVAHIFPVSTHSKIMYEDCNCLLLNRLSHTRLDNMQNPVTGNPINKEIQFNWWKRIAGSSQWSQLLDLLDYIPDYISN